MAVRLQDDALWSEPFYQPLPPLAKLLYLWSFTNPHCDAPGIYPVGIQTISFETGIPQDKLPDLFDMLKGRVEWYPNEGLVWVRDFLRRQNWNPSYLARARRKLDQIKMYCSNGLIDEVLEFNLKLGIMIPLIGKEQDKTSKIGKYSVSEALSIASGKIKVSETERKAVSKALEDKGYNVS